MTKDEITALAAQVWSADGVYIGPSIAQLAEFAALVAAKEREAWIVGLRPAITQSMGAEQVREAIQKVIRARSQQ